MCFGTSSELLVPREGVGKREFPVEEGSERSECWKTVGFQGGNVQ